MYWVLCIGYCILVVYRGWCIGRCVLDIVYWVSGIVVGRSVSVVVSWVFYSRCSVVGLVYRVQSVGYCVLCGEYWVWVKRVGCCLSGVLYCVLGGVWKGRELGWSGVRGNCDIINRNITYQIT